VIPFSDRGNMSRGSSRRVLRPNWNVRNMGKSRVQDRAELRLKAHKRSQMETDLRTNPRKWMAFVAKVSRERKRPGMR
jgi:hypothetical protein